MRWSEQQLAAHKKAQALKKKAIFQADKTKNDPKVRQKKKARNNANETKIGGVETLTILDCEIVAIPPSVNHYWERSKYGYKLSNMARDFHHLMSLYVPKLNTTSRLKLDVTFHFPDWVRRDIDNYLKATIDSLVKCGFCADDEQFDCLVVNRGPVVAGGLIKIKVFELG